jgi:hypothetical protein
MPPRDRDSRTREISLVTFPFGLQPLSGRKVMLLASIYSGAI